MEKEVNKKWNPDERKIDDLFNAPKDQKSPFIYLDIDTSSDLCFKLSDFEIICFDRRVPEEKKGSETQETGNKEVQNNKTENKDKDQFVENKQKTIIATQFKGLKKISTCKWQEEQDKNDIKKKKNYAKEILNFKSQQDLLKDLKQLEINPAKDKQYSDLELEKEEITRVVLSYDETKIYLGTSFGRVVLINTIDFEVLGMLQNILDSPVIDITSSENKIYVSHEDGQINEFTKEKNKETYFRKEIKASNDFQERFKPKLRCEKNHRLMKLTKKPKYYKDKENLVCSECQQDLKDKDEWLHCKTCSLDICSDCTENDKFQKEKTDSEQKDKEGHVMKLIQNSKDKKQEICCDLCKQQNLQSQNQWYNCDECKSNKCFQCPSKWYCQESNQPTCCLDHQLQLIKKKKDYDGSCAECQRDKIQNSGLWYHCQKCEYDLCYYCYNYTPVKAMRLYRDFIFYVQQYKDYKRFLVCYDLNQKKEFGRQKFNSVDWDDN